MRLSLELAKLLIEGWREDVKVRALIAKHAWGEDILDNRSEEEWGKALDLLKIPSTCFCGMRVRSWIALHFYKANEAMWDNKPNTAIRHMISGKDGPRSSYQTHPAVVKMKKDRGIRIIKARQLDMAHDWKTVK